MVDFQPMNGNILKKIFVEVHGLVIKSLINYMFIILLLAAGACGAGEVRGAWVTAWNPGFLTPAETDATFAAAKKAKINTLFIQVRKTGDAYYNSHIEAKDPSLPENYDPLDYIIRKAHSEGIKVHAWVNVCRIWRGKTLPQDPKHVVNLHPDWLNKDSTGSRMASEGIFIDPGVPDARDYVVSVIKDIVINYDVDGIHLDYIRYPGKDWGYSQVALERFAKQTGMTEKPAFNDPTWCKWRRGQVTALVSEIRKTVKKIKPGVKLTAATIAWRDCKLDFTDCAPYNLTYQNWHGWLNDGLLDGNVPMNYRSDSSSAGAQQFRAWLNGFKKWGGGKPTYVGIDIYHNDVKGIMRQVQAIKAAKLAGFALFSLNDLPARQGIVDALSK